MDNIQIPLHDMTANDALPLVVEIVKQVYLSKQIGIGNSLFNIYVKGHKSNGSPISLPAKWMPQTNEAIHQIGRQLSTTRITEDDALNQIKQLGKMINLPWLLGKELGLTPKQLQMRIYDKSESVYGKFTPDMLRTINTSILTAAFQLMQINIVAPVRKNP